MSAGEAVVPASPIGCSDEGDQRAATTEILKEAVVLTICGGRASAREKNHHSLPTPRACPLSVEFKSSSAAELRSSFLDHGSDSFKMVFSVVAHTLKDCAVIKEIHEFHPFCCLH